MTVNKPIIYTVRTKLPTSSSCRHCTKKNQPAEADWPLFKSYQVVLLFSHSSNPAPDIRSRSELIKSPVPWPPLLWMTTPGVLPTRIVNLSSLLPGINRSYRLFPPSCKESDKGTFRSCRDNRLRPGGVESPYVISGCWNGLIPGPSRYAAFLFRFIADPAPAAPVSRIPRR